MRQSGTRVKLGSPQLKSPSRIRLGTLLRHGCAGAWRRRCGLEPFPANRLRFRASGAGHDPRARRPDGAQPPGRNGHGDGDAPITVIEYASMTCRHCAIFGDDVFRNEEALHRYRQGRFHFPGISPRPAGRCRFILARCAGPDKYSRSIGPCSPNNGLGWCRNRSAAVGDRQAGRLEPAGFRSLPGQRELLEGIEKVRNQASEKLGVIPRRLSSSTASAWPAPSRSRKWKRNSLPISRADKGFSWAPGSGAAPAPAMPRGRTHAGALYHRPYVRRPAMSPSVAESHSPIHSPAMRTFSSTLSAGASFLAILALPAEGRLAFARAQSKNRESGTTSHETDATAPARLQVFRRADRFPDRTRADRLGRTNGCGKSNLVEALRWVMGAASHKAMRAPTWTT